MIREKTGVGIVDVIDIIEIVVNALVTQGEEFNFS